MIYWKTREGAENGVRSGRDWSLGTRVMGGEGKRETGGGQDPAFKRELSKCLQDVLLVAAAGHFLSGQHPKVRLVQMPK